MKKNYIKKLNIFTIICILSYIFSFLSFYVDIKSDFEYYENVYATLLSQANDFNYIKQTNSGSKNIEKETPKFTCAKDAIDFTWNKLQNYTSYELDIIGIVTAIAGPVEKKVKTNIIQCFYEDGSVCEETKIYDSGSFANQTRAITRYYHNGYVYTKGGSALSINNDGTINSSYTTELKKDYEQDKHYTYIFNKDTITKQLYFKVNYNPFTGKVDSYSASAYLNCKTSVNGYDKQTKIYGNLNNIPSFSLVEINCLIDANGDLISMTIKDEYTGKYTYSGITMDYKSRDDFNIVIKNVNSSPSAKQPVVD